MHRYSNISALLLTSVMQTGCIEAAFQEGVALAPTATGTSTSSTSESEIPTTSVGDGGGGPGVQTVTGAEESSNPVGDGSSTDDETSGGAETSVGDSTGAPVNAPPEVGLFADPPQLNEAGASEIKLTASADVVLARLRLNGEQIFEGPPAKFPYVYEALSAKYNVPHHFEVEVEDEEGLKDTDTTDLVVQLPQPGAEKCLFKDSGALASAVSALAYTRKAIYAVGVRDTGSGLKLTVWALDPDHCEVVLPGWPKTIASWTGEPVDLGTPMSGGVAIAVDEIGNLAIGGNLIVNGSTQPYVALLTSDGARLWERTGSVGSELAGLAAFTDQFSDRVVGVGWRRTNDNPVRTDAQIWTYQPTDDDWVILTEYTLKAPFLPGEKLDDLNQRSEWARAVLVKDGVAFIVGEREFWDDDVNVYSRAFMAKLHPIGPVEPLWTSWGVHSVNDAARSIAVCGEQMVTGGWDRDKPVNAKPEPLIVWFDEDGAFAGSRPDALAWTQTNGIACDREGKIVSGGVRLSGDGDAQVFTVPGQIGQRTWYEVGVAGPDAVGAVACDPRGFCAGGGWRTVNGKFYAAVRVFHP